MFPVFPQPHMPAEIFRFEDFELDRIAFELRRAGRVARLERIPLELLFLLVEHRGQLVTRQEILDCIWGNDVFLDTDNAINTAIRKIRVALKDNAENPRFLHTLPGMGYRFDAQVVEPNSNPIPIPISTPLLPPGVPIAARPQGRRLAPWIALAAAVFLCAAYATRTYLSGRSKTSSGKVMLVVMPFVNMNDDPHQNYFVDGITEEIIAQLGSLDPAHLGVIARTSSMQYKGAHKDAAQIAHELGTAYLLEGSVRREGQRVRITAQLIQAGDQSHLWADSFDRDLNDILKLQSELARDIAAKIQLTLSEQTERRLASARSLNSEAHEAYLQGLQAWNLRTKDAFQQAIGDFDRAIQIDPNYAPAYSGLAQTYMLAPIFGLSETAEAMLLARSAAARAVGIDSSLGEAHTVLGFVKAHFDFDWPGAEREFRRAIELNPSDAGSHLFYSNSYLSPLGRHNEAIAEMQEAVRLDPFSLPIQSFLGRTYIWARRYDEAEAQFKKTNQLNTNFAINHERLGHLYASVGKYEEAIEEETKARILSGEDPKSAVAKGEELRRAYTASGARGYWMKVLEFSGAKEGPPEGYSSSSGVAIVLAKLGEKEKAVELLEKAYAERSLFMTELNIEPAFDDLKSSSRFSDLVRRVHLYGGPF
jgi:TolB-like protein/DNA-binding winged helix-turn-helix (wHTH) protein/Tfp pilus assembly protein PilF